MNKNVKVAKQLLKLARVLMADEDGEHPYHEHFREKLEEHGVDSPAELPSDEHKKDFFEKVTDEWEDHPENKDEDEDANEDKD